MAQPQNDLDQGMPPSETCILQGSVHAGRLRLQGPLLWEDVFYMEIKVPEEETDEDEDQHRQDAVERWGKILPSLGLFCEKTQFVGSSSGGEQFSPAGIEGALKCLHRDDSSLFELDPEAEARSLHVAGVISLNCLLLLMGMYGQNKDTSGIAEHSDSSDELLSLSDKWKWSGAACKDAFNEWIRRVLGRKDAEEAMKLLYQWTVVPIHAVLSRVERIMDGAIVCGDDEYTEGNHVSKWSHELSNFLREYRTLLASGVTEFLYCDKVYNFLRRTALLHSRMGDRNRTRVVLEMIKEMLEGICGEDPLMITAFDEGKIAYDIEPNQVTVLDRQIDVVDQLELQGGDDYKYLLGNHEDRREFRDKQDGLRSETNYCSLLHWSISLFGGQIFRILSAFGSERINEARECFKQIDMKNIKLKAKFRDFLFGAHIGDFIHHSCSGSTLKWETIREKQDFLLDVCEVLGDPQLTARCSQSCGWMIYQHSYDIFENIEDTQSLIIRLKEELNLQLTSPAPECLQDLISCLNDPYKSNEHKRDNLPDMLKGLRLMKRSIDIYSDLLLNSNWSILNEVEWLKLLESQKNVQNKMLNFHQRLLNLCNKGIIMSCTHSLVNRHDRHNLLCAGPAENSIHQGSNLLSRVLRSASSALHTSMLVWIERGRARTLLRQLGHGDGPYPGSLKEELFEFYNNQQAALSSILSCRSACKGGTLFVEYLSESAMQLSKPKLTAIAFIIHKRGIGREYLDAGSSDEVEKMLDDFYNTVPQQRTNAAVVVKLHSILEKLFDLFIEPVLHSPALNTLESPNATLVIVPDKALYRVPFALLRDKKTQKYLFQLHPIAIAPSLRVLQHCERRVRDLQSFPLKPDGCILAVGNAAYESVKDRLPGTGKELEHLRLCFPGLVKTLEGEEATRSKFLDLVEEISHSKEGHAFACIHLGVHGHWREIKNGAVHHKTGSLRFAKPPDHFTGGESNRDASKGELLRSPQCSTSVQMEEGFIPRVAISTDGQRQGNSFGEVGIVTRATNFASTTAEDMLPSEEIVKSSFQWRSPLVVLSACNSSRGVQDFSDGEVNLPRALMIAGVPAAVVSQWKIDDLASPRLIESLYENLRCGQDVATALQSTMLQLSNSESKSANNIFEWDSFLVWGLPTVQLPKELWTENARKSLPARQHSELLRCALDDLVERNVKVEYFKNLKAVESLLASASCKECALEVGAIIDAIIGVEQLLSALVHEHRFSDIVTALAEEFYALILPLDQFKEVVLELEKHSTEKFMLSFWKHMRFMQAVKGSHELALDYDRKISEVGLKENQTFKSSVERAVILRLMGKYEEALKEFANDLYMDCRKCHYECLIQMSYLLDRMEDKSGALDYACGAKKLKGDIELYGPDRGAFRLGLKALPDDYRCWLLNVDKSSWATSNFVRNVLSVQLPEELLTADARKASAGIQQARLLRWNLHRLISEHKVMLLKALDAVITFLASVYSACALEEEAVVDAILNIEILMLVRGHVSMLKVLNALAEIVYTLVPFDQLLKLGHEYVSSQYHNHVYFVLIRTKPFDKHVTFRAFDTIPFRLRIVYIQAMRDGRQISLDNAETLLEYIRHAIECEHDESVVQAFRNTELFVRQERAVILRLMGKYGEALKEFCDLLANREEYEYLIQLSYLMHLMKDKSGALEYACRAKRLDAPWLARGLDRPGMCAFVLGYKALPDGYRRWLLNVDGSVGTTSCAG